MRSTSLLVLFVVAFAPISTCADEQPGQKTKPPESKATSTKPKDGQPDDSQAKDGKPEDDTWKSMFDGKSLKGWKPAKGVDYEDQGKIFVKDKRLVLETGQPATGVRWTGKFPKMDYEVKLEACRLKGSDFFCGLTFPVGDGSLTLILGGWGGWVVGLSDIDGFSAVDNETCQGLEFKNDHWYHVRLRVTKQDVKVWLDDDQPIDFETKGHKLNVRWEMEPCLPFGVATWNTTGGLRNIRYRPLAYDRDKKSQEKKQ